MYEAYTIAEVLEARRLGGGLHYVAIGQVNP